MKRPSWRQSLVMIMFGSLTMLGCNHAGHRYDCVSTIRPSGQIVMLPAPAPETAPLPSSEPDNKAQATSLPGEAMVQTAAVKRPEAPLGAVAVPIVADSTAGSQTGTFVLSAEDAEAMGVRPGYTPGALIMPPPK